VDDFKESVAPKQTEKQKAKKIKKLKQNPENAAAMKKTNILVNETMSDSTDWSSLDLHEDILKGLNQLGFESPTEIQAKSLPFSLAGRDIVGAAETVSCNKSFI